MPQLAMILPIHCGSVRLDYCNDVDRNVVLVSSGLTTCLEAKNAADCLACTNNQQHNI